VVSENQELYLGFSSLTTNHSGHWRNPLSDAGVTDKFRRLAADLLSESWRNTALDLLWSLERLPNLTALFDSLAV
jgi:2-methylcitrate dehydratase